MGTSMYSKIPPAYHIVRTFKAAEKVLGVDIEPTSISFYPGIAETVVLFLDMNRILWRLRTLKDVIVVR